MHTLSIALFSQFSISLCTKGDFFAIRRGLARVIVLFGHPVFQSCRLATAGAIVEERCFSRISRGPITYSVVLATLNLDVFKNHPAADFS